LKDTTKQRNLVNEITLDMAGNMGLIAKRGFQSNAGDWPVYVQKTASEVL
jgi:hypothetical protein